jgi:Lrp/AsnC family leucine-responsive transcriptional regulator
MKSDSPTHDLDPTDLAILDQLQINCKLPLAEIGGRVGLGASAVMERIHKLEAAGVIRGYAALLDARAIGQDVAAFIGVTAGSPRAVSALAKEIEAQPDVLECHHVTGGYTMLLKAKTRNTATLEHLIDAIREMEGVSGTQTMVVLSTQTERLRLPLDVPPVNGAGRGRKNAGSRVRGAAGQERHDAE